MSQKHKQSKPLTVPAFVARKAAGKKITMLTAYDYTIARLLDDAGVDSILVGDSMGMVVQGHATTLPVTLDEMIYHGRLVTRAVKRALVIVDMPFPTNHLGIESAIASAARILKETGCTAVKLEGGAEQATVIAAMVAAGIPVMAHAGLQPQSVHTMGGYRVQRDEPVLLADAKAAEQAGAFGIVLECVPQTIARKISDSIGIPTIGIGAGVGCDGQVLVTHDLIGLTTGYVPSFVKPYAAVGEAISAAARKWQDDVLDGTFPDDDHSFD